jgi:hypothetical protein
MRYKIAFILLLAVSSIAHAKELAFTLDDSPRRADGYFDGPTRAKTLLAELKRHNIPQVAFFSVSQKLDKEGMQRLQASHTGRSPKHVLLLHEMDITALFVGDLADSLRAKGWDIISPEKAYTDDIASYQTQSVLKNNPGRVGEIARDKGKSDLWHRTLDEGSLRERFMGEVLGPEAAEGF